jgi:orotate phosphoribosyltransferase
VNDAMTEQGSIESELLLAGVLRYEPFISAAGLEADQKIVLDDLWYVHEKDSAIDLLARKVIGSLSVRAALLSPTHFVAIPNGGNPIVARMATNCMDVGTMELRKHSHTHGDKSLVIDGDFEAQDTTARVVLVDDVLTTGHSLLAAAAVPELSGRVVGAAVIWDRRESPPQRALPFPVVSVVKRYVALRSQP